MKKLMNVVRRFGRDEAGTTAIEYGLIATFIAVAIIVGVRALGIDLNAVFTNVAAEI